MRIKIRLVAVIGAAALAAIALASLPTLAQDNASTPDLNTKQRGGGKIADFDRKRDGDHAVRQPKVPPVKEVKPGRVAASPGNPSAGDATNAFGASLVGGGSTMSSRTERVERSLKSVADRLR